VYGRVVTPIEHVQLKYFWLFYITDRPWCSFRVCNS